VDPQLRKEYAQIGSERDAAGRLADREKFWFFVKLAAACWGWVAVGAVVMAQGFHINAVVGQFYFPDLMDRAQLWVEAGGLIGVAGPLGTLIYGWRVASRRGYLD
jgi:hypothetical protein